MRREKMSIIIIVLSFLLTGAAAVAQESPEKRYAFNSEKLTFITSTSKWHPVPILPSLTDSWLTSGWSPGDSFSMISSPLPFSAPIHPRWICWPSLPGVRASILTGWKPAYRPVFSWAWPSRRTRLSWVSLIIPFTMSLSFLCLLNLGWG